MQSASPSPARVLVVCTGNRCRSQMAHGWLRHAGGESVEVSSAGTEPGGVHPLAVSVMSEIGIDISEHSSNHVSEYLVRDFDVVVTVCDDARTRAPPCQGRSERSTEPSRILTLQTWILMNYETCSVGSETRSAYGPNVSWRVWRLQDPARTPGNADRWITRISNS